MDAVSVSTSTAMDPLNETGVGINRWNTNVPSYLYNEVPTVFEVIGIVLNVMMIIYFIKSKRYQAPLFTILTSLAVMDACVCLGGSMFIFAYPTLIAPEAGFMCAVLVIICMIGLVGSEYHLILFTGLRLYQVMFPLKSRASVTVGLMLKYCATIVVVSTCSAIAYAASWTWTTTVIDGKEITACIFIGYSTDMAYMVILTVIPCATIFLIHVCKYFAYVRSRGMIEAQHERKSPDARVAFIVIALFYICWVPGMTYLVIQHVSSDDFTLSSDSLFMVLQHVMYANSIMNPLVYVLAVKSIRDELCSLFCFRKQKI